MKNNRMLLNLSTGMEYSEQILYPVAETLLQAGRCKEAILVYKLSFVSKYLYLALFELSNTTYRTLTNYMKYWLKN